MNLKNLRLIVNNPELDENLTVLRDDNSFGFECIHAIKKEKVKDNFNDKGEFDALVFKSD